MPLNSLRFVRTALRIASEIPLGNKVCFLYIYPTLTEAGVQGGRRPTTPGSSLGWKRGFHPVFTQRRVSRRLQSRGAHYSRCLDSLREPIQSLRALSVSCLFSEADIR